MTSSSEEGRTDRQAPGSPASRGGRSRPAVRAAVALLALVALGAGGAAVVLPDGSEAPPTPAGEAGEDGSRAAATGAAQEGEPADQRLTPVVAAARRVLPSVVSVNVVRREEVRRGIFDFWVPRGYERTVRSLGSGFVIDEDGYLLTNQHVVRGAVEVVVADREGRSWEAEIVGTDELTDIAVLRIPAGEVPPAELGTSSDLMVGEPAIAVGSPYGYLLSNPEPTVTAGVISGVGRDIRPGRSGEALYADMIQTDASINPGNSGGPLVNVLGRVVGVNSSIFSPSPESGSVGLGFAIPIDRAVRLAREIRTHGRIRRPWVGMDLRQGDGSGSGGGGPRQGGALVVERVADASPAHAAGLRPGDVVVSAGGEAVRSPLDWEIRLLESGVGSTLPIRYRRDGEVRSATLPIRELPSERAERIEVLRGLEMVTVTPSIAQERDLPFREGALIVEVSDRVRSATDLRRGDVIVGMNRQRIRTAEEAAEAFRDLAGRGAALVQLYRDGSLRTRTLYIR